MHHLYSSGSGRSANLLLLQLSAVRSVKTSTSWFSVKPGRNDVHQKPGRPKIRIKEPDFAILALKPGTSEVIWEFSEDSGSDQP